jgi:hypothetical protein
VEQRDRQIGDLICLLPLLESRLITQNQKKRFDKTICSNSEMNRKEERGMSSLKQNKRHIFATLDKHFILSSPLHPVQLYRLPPSYMESCAM